MKLSRRDFLKLGGVTLVAVAGGSILRAVDQGVFSVGHGIAYEPWKNWRDAQTPIERIVAARRIAQHESSSADFHTGDISALTKESADVVSAASLLAVLPDREAGLHSLWRTLRPGGTLLIVEPTRSMTVDNANRAIQNGLPQKRINGLRMWATARQGNIVDPAIYETLDAEAIRAVSLLQGLAGAWIIQKKEFATAYPN